MGRENLQLLGISFDVKYIFTNRGILETSAVFQKGNGRFIEYTEENLPIGLEMVKEHYQTFYNAGQISLVEYSNSPRKFLYNLFEILQPNTQSTILKEWEEIYGNKLLLINESVDKLIVESRINDAWVGVHQILEWTLNPLSSEFYSGKNWSEIGSGVVSGAKKAVDWGVDQVKKGGKWVADQAKQIGEKGFFTWAGEKVSAVWNSVKNAIAKAWNCLTANFFECLMEGIREMSFSAIGMGVMTALTFIQPIGAVVDVVVFGSLLVWDVYKMLSGKYESGPYKWSWMDIIVDAVCCILPYAGKLFKAEAAGVKSMAELGTKAATEGGIFKKTLNYLKGGFSKIGSAIAQGIKWIGEKLGLEFLTKFGSKAESVIGKGIKEATAAEAKAATKTSKSFLKRGAEAVSNFGKSFKLTKPLPVVMKSTGKMVILTAGLCAALGHDGWTCKEKVENGEITPEQIAKAENELKAGLKSGDLKKEMDKMTVDDAANLGLF